MTPYKETTMWSSAVACLVTLTLGLLAAPPITTAQPQGKLPLVGVLEPGRQQAPSGCLPAFQQSLRDLGYVEGHTIRLAYRYGEGHADRLPALAAELVQLNPDVIWLASTQAVAAAKQATTTIPIVIAVASNLVERGLVASLARPGGNLTGLDLRTADLVAKQLEVLKDAVPTISRVAVLADPTNPFNQEMLHNLEQAARALGVQLQPVEAGAPAAFEVAFATMVNGGAEALLIVNQALFGAHRQQLLALALRHRLPTVSYGRSFAEVGSLLTIGAEVRELCQRSAIFVHKILHGATPAELPIERVDKFPLVVNLKTAEALGLTLSPLFLFRADEVIK
jgi:putative tryptophan/tyrosine transport system substrate-binding protein